MVIEYRLNVSCDITTDLMKRWAFEAVSDYNIGPDTDFIYIPYFRLKIILLLKRRENWNSIRVLYTSLYV